MLKVVIVDDEVFVRDIMVDFIDWGSYGVEVVGTAQDGDSAYALIHQTRPDIVMIDIEMPNMSGLEVIERIRQEKIVQPAFIIISGYSDFNYAQKAIRLSVCEYLLKPLSPLDVISAIQKSVRYVGSIHQLQANTAAEPTLKNLLQENRFLHFPMVKYPAETEKSLLETVMTGLATDVRNILETFRQQALQNNQHPDALLYCGLMLYIELCRFLTQRGIVLPDSFYDDIPLNKAEASEKLFSIIEQMAVFAQQQINKNQYVSHYVKQVMAYIHAHFAENITLDAIAEQVSLSPTYLCKLFKQIKGVNIIAYIQHVRIEKAKTLLLNTNYKVYELASLVGYEDAKYFSQIFKKMVGASPSDFRKQAAQ